IWQHIAKRTDDEALIISDWPETKAFDQNLIDDFENASSVISAIRTIRKEKNIPFRDAIELKAINRENTSTYFDAVITKLGNISTLDYVADKVDGALSFRVNSNEYFIPVSGAIN